jgi:hypothetical protein
VSEIDPKQFRNVEERKISSIGVLRKPREAGGSPTKTVNCERSTGRGFTKAQMRCFFSRRDNPLNAAYMKINVSMSFNFRALSIRLQPRGTFSAFS